MKDEYSKEIGVSKWNDNAIRDTKCVDEIAKRYHKAMLEQLLPTEEEIKEQYPISNLYIYSPNSELAHIINRDHSNRQVGAKWVIQKLKEEK